MADRLERLIAQFEVEGKGSAFTEDFCRNCGANIPPITGEGTCPECDPEGCAKHGRDLQNFESSNP